MATKFAPAGRATAEILRKQVELFSGDRTITELAEAIISMLVILNAERQIVLANTLFVDSFAEGNIEKIIGLRPGEAAGCMHAALEPGGCGTTEFCKTCGAIKAILDSQKGEISMEECQIGIDNNLALDLRVSTLYQKW
ncbi:MAG: hypothetical protein U5L72_01510 [Bacteroidales bacterium]|nr:hypothetical protein [Bacteroidales bacterium]